MPERESAPAGANGKRDPAGEAANPAAGEAANPIVACVTRADRVESVHRGFGAAVEPDGSVVAAFGDPETPIF
ncbi:MAG TPA: hypothetical protein VFL12_01345, partial [Thermoanaerobaculia bacterium]|nr:hypothetical protein [Thermoanaerobaculia bacterium]